MGLVCRSCCFRELLTVCVTNDFLCDDWLVSCVSRVLVGWVLGLSLSEWSR